MLKFLLRRNSGGRIATLSYATLSYIFIKRLSPLDKIQDPLGNMMTILLITSRLFIFYLFNYARN